MPVFLSYFALHFFLSLLICGFGIFFIFLSGGQFDDVSSWLFLSRNFLFLLVKVLSSFFIYKCVEFYWSGKYSYKENFSLEHTFPVSVFFIALFFLRSYGNNWGFWELSDTNFFIYFLVDLYIFYFLRAKIRAFSNSDRFVIGFLFTVNYLLVYQEKLELGLFFFITILVLLDFLNKWNDLKNVFLGAFALTLTFNFYSQELSVLTAVYSSCLLATFIWKKVRYYLTERTTQA